MKLSGKLAIIWKGPDRLKVLGQFKRFFSVMTAKTFQMRKNFPVSNATLLPRFFCLCFWCAPTTSINWENISIHKYVGHALFSFLVEIVNRNLKVFLFPAGYQHSHKLCDLRAERRGHTYLKINRIK